MKMKILDYFRYVKTIFINNKLRSIISFLISLILSYIICLLFIIGFNYYENSYNARINYLTNNKIIVSVDSSKNRIDEVVEFGRKFSSNTTSFTTFGIELYDFEKEFNYKLISGKLPESKSKDILVNSNTNYNVGDLYEYKDEKFQVCGIYESDYIDLIIGDILGHKDIVDATTISLSFYGENAVKNVSNIKTLMSELDDASFKYSINNVFDNYESIIRNANITLAIVVILTIVLFLSSIGFLSNSIRMSISESDKLFNILNLVGSKRKNIFFIIVLYMLIIVVTSIIISTIFAFLTFNFINLKDMYDLIIPSQLRNGNFEYEIKFLWYIPLIMIFVFALYVLIYANLLLKKELKDMNFRY